MECSNRHTHNHRRIVSVKRTKKQQTQKKSSSYEIYIGTRIKSTKIPEVITGTSNNNSQKISLHNSNKGYKVPT